MGVTISSSSLMAGLLDLIGKNRPVTMNQPVTVTVFTYYDYTRCAGIWQFGKLSPSNRKSIGSCG